jgi:hypothetical protein
MELKKMNDKIIEKYKEKIKEIYAYSYDNETAHAKRDYIYKELVEELGYKELADLLEKVEEDIGFWYA